MTTVGRLNQEIVKQRRFRRWVGAEWHADYSGPCRGWHFV